MSVSHRTSTLKLTLKYLLSLCLLAGLSLANHLILAAQIQGQQSMASVVHTSSEQRSFLQSTARISQRMVTTADASQMESLRGELQQELDRLETAHHTLIRENETSSEPPASVQAIYFNAPWLFDTEMRNYIAQSRSLAEAPLDEMTPDNAHFRYISRAAESGNLVQGLDAVVAAYQAEAEQRSLQLNWLALWSFGSTLTLLTLTGLLVFRPMVRQVGADMHTLAALNATLEQRVAARTEELSHSEALYRSLVEHLPMCLLRKDREGRFSFVSDRFCELVGRPASQILGRSDADLFPEPLARKYSADDHWVMDTERAFHDIEQHHDSDGRTTYVEVLKTVLRNGTGEVIGTQTMFWDVTDRKEAEARALQAERLAAIGQMVTGVAHESRNALQQMQACTKLLEWELNGQSAAVGDLIADLFKEQERLRRLFDDLRGYAAPHKLELRKCRLPDICQAAWNSLTTLRQGRDIELQESLDGEDVTCLVDPFQFEQVFRNLLENAIHACSDPVRIAVRYTSEEDDGSSRLRVSVSDNGPGLTPEQRSRVFDAFYTTSTTGTGLGMAIVKRIVEVHGGTAAVGSPSTGAEFILEIPRGST